MYLGMLLFYILNQNNNHSNKFDYCLSQYNYIII